MEQKDPNFSLDDYVDISGITHPKQYEIISETLQGLADSAVLDGQTIFKEAFEKQGHRIIINTTYGDASQHVSGEITISFKEVSSYAYLTDPASAKLNPNNFNDIASASKLPNTPISLSEVIWHELEHARDELTLLEMMSPPIKEVHVIEATNKNFREPLGLPPRYSHILAHTDNGLPIETLEQTKQRAFEEQLPDLELTFNGECIACEEVDANDAPTPENTPTNEQLASLKARE